MLKKLIRYDLENIFKVLVIFYGLSLFFGILTRILFSIENSFIIDIIAKVCSGVTISMIFNILINNLMRMWSRFKNNFYGDESYLTHTLPVEKKTLYLSKTIASFVTLFLSVFVIGVTLFIAYYSKENIEIIKNMLLPVANSYDSTIIGILLVFLFVFFLEFINILQSGFTGLILGHKMNNHKISLSVLFGFIAYMVIQVFALFMIFIVALFNDNIMNLFFTNVMIDMETMKLVIYLSIFVYIVTFIGEYFINLKLFKKGVNVD